MKIRIEAEPGELEGRLEEALATVRELGGGELCKADLGGEPDRPPAWPVLEQAVYRARRHQVDRVQRIMQRRIAEVVLGRE